jgi:putative ABC transport system permease protein
MSPIALAAANVRTLWPRFIGLAALLATTVSLCATSFAVSGSAERAAHDRVQEGAANRTVTVERPADRSESKPLAAAALKELAAIPNVASVQPRAQASFGYKDATIEGVLLYATTLRLAQPPPVTRKVREQLFPLAANEVVLPERAQGMDLTPLLDRTIEVQTTRAVASGQGVGAQDRVHVVGFFAASWQVDGPDAAYADDATVLRWAAAKAGVTVAEFTTSIGYDQVSVVVDQAGNVAGVLGRVQAAGFAGHTLQQELDALPGVLALIRTTGTLLLVVLGVVALVGALVVTGALARHRVREIGVLKAIGFRTRFVLTVLVAEMAFIGGIGALAGTLLGGLLAVAVAAALRGQPELGPYLSERLPLPSAGSLATLFAVAIAVTVLGAWLPALRAARMAPSDAMKEW